MELSRLSDVPAHETVTEEEYVFLLALPMSKIGHPRRPAGMFTDLLARLSSWVPKFDMLRNEPGRLNRWQIPIVRVAAVARIHPAAETQPRPQEGFAAGG